MWRSALGLVLGVILFSATAMADMMVESIPLAKVPLAVKQRMQIYETLGVRVMGYVKGPGNLIGVVAQVPENLITNVKGLEVFATKDRRVVFFVSPDAHQMLVGFAFDLTTGRELVSEIAAHYTDTGPEGPPPRGAGVVDWQQFPESDLAVKFIETSPSGPSKDKNLYYCFVDMQCPHSRAQFREMERLGARVRWVPITLGGPVSTTRASYLLALDNATTSDLKGYWDKESTVREVFWRFDEEEKKALGKGVFLLEQNTTFAFEHGIKSTPTCLHIVDGKVKHVYRGVVDANFLKSNSTN